MSTVDVLPDVVAITRIWLLSRPALTDLVGIRISTRTAAAPAYPYLTLQRIGGIPAVRRRLDTARIQIDAWGSDEASASLVARTARAELHRMEGYRHRDGVITAVDDVLGVAWAPFTPSGAQGSTPKPRFTFDVEISAHIP